MIVWLKISKVWNVFFMIFTFKGDIKNIYTYIFKVNWLWIIFSEDLCVSKLWFSVTHIANYRHTWIYYIKRHTYILHGLFNAIVFRGTLEWVKGRVVITGYVYVLWGWGKVLTFLIVMMETCWFLFNGLSLDIVRVTASQLAQYR